MSEIRVGRRRGYTVVENGLLPEGEAKISARAWGVYVYLLSRPPGWIVRPGHLQTVFTEGRDAVYGAIRELVSAGLMVKETYRNEAGLPRQRFAIPDEPGADSPDTDSQDTGFPDPGFPDPEKPHPSHSREITTPEKDSLRDSASAEIEVSAGGGDVDTPLLDAPHVNGPKCDTEPVSKPSQPRRRDVSDDDPAWAAWWETYPRKVGKGAARKAWVKATSKIPADELQQATQAFALHVAAGHVEKRFIPHPSTWLNSERWTDDLGAVGGGQPTRNGGILRHPDAGQVRTWDDFIQEQGR